MKTLFRSPITILLLLVIAIAASASASNKGETPEEAPSRTDAPASESAAAQEPAAEAPEVQSEPEATGIVPTAEAAEAESVPDEEEAPLPSPEATVEAAGRPELPSIDEGAELDTVREDAPGDIAGAEQLSPKTLTLLKALETRHASIVTVHGDFDQLKVSDIFLEEIKSKGSFRFKKPDQFRCDYEPPDEMTNLIREDAIYIYVPELEQCEVYRFTSDQERDQQLHSMVLGFGFRTAELIEAYFIQSSEDAGSLLDELKRGGKKADRVALLELTPRPEVADTSPFTRLKLWIDKEDLLPEKVWFEDYNGDQTTLDIHSIELNISIDPKLFVPSFPSGTEYIDKSES